jgi:uncharacterized protein YndB with AHSA1/START domain
MTQFRATIEIARPRDEVFAYLADAGRLPTWNSAVESVVPLHAPAGGASGRYVMQRRLPTGPATNELEVVEVRPPDQLRIRTTNGPTPFIYRYAFATTAAGTLVTLNADVTLGPGRSLLGTLAAHAIKRGVDANLATLRDLLEHHTASNGEQ